MKYINKIFSLFAIALMAVACDPDAESYTPGGLEEGNQGICFAGNYTQTVEVEPGVTSFILTLKRSVTDAAGSVDIKVLNNEENIFICPSTASFAAGEATTTLTVETPDLYPDIVTSTPFITGLFYVRVKDLDGEIDTTLYCYLNDYQRMPWWSLITSAPFKAVGWAISLLTDEDDDDGILDPFHLTKEEVFIIIKT